MIVLILALALGIVNTVIPNSFSAFTTMTPYENQEITTDNVTINEALVNMKLYSIYNNQTLTDAKLEQLSTDFYVPTRYGDVIISWSSDSERMSISEIPEIITIQSISGDVAIGVLRVSITSLPSPLEGNDPFELLATLSFENDIATKTYSGALIPIMPDDFWGGAYFTFVRYLSLFVEGVITTLGLSLAGTIIGFFVALILVFMRLEQNQSHRSQLSILLKKGLSGFSKLYITVFRGTPMIVQAAFFWYGLGLFGNAMLCGLFVVSINTAAYIAEILRGGIQSVDSGQIEAARSLGMSNFQAMRYIIFPQAIKNSMPAIGNEFVINIKDTSVL